VTDKTHDVVCVGNAIVDVISSADDGFLDAQGMVKGSMQLIDDTVVHELYAVMPPGIESSGGSAANTAAGLTSFGSRAAFIGKVADDVLGEVFTHDIRAAGVTYHPLRPDGSGSTARCLIIVTPDAQRTLNTYLGVSGQLTADDIDADLVASGKVVYCEGYLWDLPDAKGALVKAMEVSHAHGGQVAFSLSDSFCVDRHRAEFRSLVADHVDVLFANEAEICSLYETDSFDEAAAAVTGTCEVACLTRGPAGSSIVTADGVVHVPAAAVDHVIDTTGAGDLFASGFLHGHAAGRSLTECGRIASVAAAEVISHVGARPATSLAALI
jgi:sugar/nucleoside kinase (ribokinase family)